VAPAGVSSGRSLNAPAGGPNNLNTPNKSAGMSAERSAKAPVGGSVHSAGLKATAPAGGLPKRPSIAPEILSPHAPNKSGLALSSSSSSRPLEATLTSFPKVKFFVF
jgi:hypothetical protein